MSAAKRPGLVYPWLRVIAVARQELMHSRRLHVQLAAADRGGASGGWVVPVHPIGGDLFDVAEGGDRAPPERRVIADALVLVRADGGLGQRVIDGLTGQLEVGELRRRRGLQPVWRSARRSSRRSCSSWRRTLSATASRAARRSRSRRHVSLFESVEMVLEAGDDAGVADHLAGPSRVFRRRRVAPARRRVGPVERGGPYCSRPSSESLSSEPYVARCRDPNLLTFLQ